MEKEFVTKEVCTEVEKRVTEHYESNAAKITVIDERQRQIEMLNARAVTLLENHQKCIDEHDNRIGVLEQKPLKFYEKLSMAIIGSILSVLVGVVVYFATK